MDMNLVIFLINFLIIFINFKKVGSFNRLVITPLTDRCWITMSVAFQNKLIPNPQGPAGTGKTETIKDLSRNLAKYLIVFNCSNKNTYSTMETIFMGLLRTGAWCCFDEFNRIDIGNFPIFCKKFLYLFYIIFLIYIFVFKYN